jgi:uncharacterized protein
VTQSRRQHQKLEPNDLGAREISRASGQDGEGDLYEVQMQMKGRHGTRQRTLPRVAKPDAIAGKARLPASPVRTCVGCRQPGSPSELVRMVLGPDGSVAFDLAGGAAGRGAWVHPVESCLRKAAKSTARSLHADGSENVEALMLSLGQAANRRAVGLVGAAHRARHVALGTDASKQAFFEGRARLVILAVDARAAKQQAYVEAAAAKGLLVAWATKSELGAMVGRDELAVLAVTDEGLAQNLLRVIAMTNPICSRVAKAAVSARTTGSQGRQDSEDG